MKRSLTFQLIRREIGARYRGSALGVVWSLLTPLLMLGIYTFVFGTVFQARWTPPQGAAPEGGPSTGEFAVILFVGLLIYQLFAEVITRAPSLITSNVNYVKKIVFPLEILVPVALGSALYHAAVSLAVLAPFMLWVHAEIPLTALALPVVLAPYCLLILGLAWFLASFGVYFRDINQILGTVITALMFLSPIFFPLSALPEWIRSLIALNPVSWPVEQARNVLIWGRLPDFTNLVIYTAVSIIIAMLGYVWFQKTRKGFADVL